MFYGVMDPRWFQCPGPDPDPAFSVKNADPDPGV